MAEKALITRRAAFVGALVSTAALAVPVAASVKRAPETAEERINYHFRELARAMNERSPGLWRGMIDHKLDVLLLHRDAADTSGRQGLQITFD